MWHLGGSTASKTTSLTRMRPQQEWLYDGSPGPLPAQVASEPLIQSPENEMDFHKEGSKIKCSWGPSGRQRLLTV